MYEIVKNYRNNDALRASFNALSKATFGLEFETWYRNGYWGEKYNPYSIVVDGQVVANVSVNTTDMLWDGSRKHFLQLGTVMTAKPYRRQGMIRRIMEEIEKDYGQDVDGIYLFANDSVLDFYPKFGFRTEKEYQYTKKIAPQEGENGRIDTLVQVPMREKSAWMQLEHAILNSASQSRLALTDNIGLLMFYVTGFMQENVYYDREQEAYVIAETEGEEVLIHNIFSGRQVDPGRIAAAFGENIRQVRLGFTPVCAEGYTMSEVREEDTTLFIKEKAFDEFEKEKLMIPTLAHA